MSSIQKRHTSKAPMAMVWTFTLLIMVLGTFVSKTTGCITVHAYMQNCVISGDITSAQAFDNGVEVCSGGSTKNAASGNTVFNIPCNPGYSLTVTGNTQSATITSPNGYTATMQAVKTQGPNTFTCANVGDSGEIKGTEFESCMFDKYWNCNLYPDCNLCDYRASC